ncbi:MAG: 16S rRNA (uracil(1498)-N(3))-methyltransferase [Bullifex sp.]
MNIILFDKDELSFARGDERYDHLKNVLHAKEGSTFRCGIINGERGSGTVTRLDCDKAEFSFTPEGLDACLFPLTVILAMVRPICMKRILREIVSLGVSRIILTSSELGEKSYRSSGLYTEGEYMKIMISGAMQGGHTGVSECVFADSVRDALTLAGDGTCLLLDNVVGSVRFSDLDLKGRNVTLAIGPERGWSSAERNAFLDAGYIPTVMGSHILRTETASVAACALALEKMGYI